jgi:hypothetical protein
MPVCVTYRLRRSRRSASPQYQRLQGAAWIVANSGEPDGMWVARTTPTCARSARRMGDARGAYYSSAYIGEGVACLSLPCKSGRAEVTVQDGGQRSVVGRHCPHHRHSFIAGVTSVHNPRTRAPANVVPDYSGEISLTTRGGHDLHSQSQWN